MKRPLPVITDRFPGCESQAHICPYDTCRYHLGAERLVEGYLFRCAIEVANSAPYGLAPSYVAQFLGITESEVQKIERRIRPYLQFVHKAIEDGEGVLPDIEPVVDVSEVLPKTERSAA